MNRFNPVWAAALGALLLAGCAKQEGPMDKAVDGAKDALNVRDHEKIKDAAEEVKDAATDAKDAAKGAVDDIKSAAKDAASDVKQAAQDAAQAAKDATSNH